MPEQTGLKKIIGTTLDPTVFHMGYLLIRPLANELSSRLKSICDGSIVLDIGGGIGPYRELLPPGARYVTTDIYPAASYAVMSQAERLGIGSEKVDVVLSTQVLEHVENPPMALGEIRRILKPGGVVYLSTVQNFTWHGCPHDYWRWTHEGMRRIFEDAGFTDVQVVRLGSSVTSIFLNLISLVDNLPLRGWPRYALLMPATLACNVAGVAADALVGLLPLDEGYHRTMAPGFLVVAQK